MEAEKNTTGISFIIPCYNAEDYIGHALDSILASKYSHLYQIVIVDDGSTDKTLSIINKYASDNPNILVIRNDHKGVSAARNTGIKAATSDYITFVDADDYVDSEFGDKLNFELSSYGADIVQCSFTYDRGEFQEEDETIPNAKYYDNNAIMDAYFAGSTGKIHIACWGKLYKRILLDDIRFDENLTIYEDAYFVYQVCRKSQKAASISLPLYNYRQHDKSAMATKLIDKYEDYYVVFDRMLADCSDNKELTYRIKWRYTTTALHQIRTLNKTELRSKALKYRKDMLLSFTSPVSLKLKLIALSITPKLYYKLMERHHD